MLDATVYADRRDRLAHRVTGPVLLMGNGDRARNLPDQTLPFRQDSNFLYFVGCDLPNAAAVIDGGQTTLFVPEPDLDDALWMGTLATLDEWREQYGVDAVLPAADLHRSVPDGARTLAVADEERNLLAQRLTDAKLRFGVAPGDSELVDAVIALRRPKSAIEISEMRRAAAVSHAAHLAVIRGTRPGGHERVLAALFEAMLAAGGCTTGYGTILTQDGEVLHNHRHVHTLQAGRLLLLDGGGEVDTGYTVDITRTWPVDGRFTGRQRAAYDVVLEAQRRAIAAVAPGVRYREIHDIASRVIARWLRDEGLITVDPDTSVQTGAHAVFFPHGVGHLLGLDVHDLKTFGDRAAYPPDRGRSELFGTRYLRLDLPLEQGWVVTIEPGFYVVPAILSDADLRERLKGQVDFDRARDWVGFGGIRIEDDVLVTGTGPDVLTSVPKDADEIEALVGSGPTAEERLGISSRAG